MRSIPTGAFGKLLLFLAGASLLVAVGAACRNRIASPASAAEPIAVSEADDPAPSPTDSAEAIGPAPAESAEMNGVQQQVAAGLVVEASNLRFDEEETGGFTLKLDVCIPMPTNADWFIYSTTLSFSGSVVGDYGTIPIEIVEVAEDGTAVVYTFENNRFTTSDRPALESEESYRCDTLYFWGLPEEVRDAELIITIDGLYASSYTGQPCTAELLARAQLAMDALAEGIVLACTADGANGHAGLGIERIPEEMSQEAAEEIFYSNEFYLAMFGVAGPWVFVYPKSTEPDQLLSLENGLENLELAEHVSWSPDPPDGFIVSQAQALLNLISRKVANSDTPWIHLISKDQEEDTRVFIMPENGMEVQVGPIFEGWFQLDSQGYVLSSVTILSDIDGNPLQISSFQDGIGRNHTLGITSADGPRHFDQFLTSLIATNGTVEIEIETGDVEELIRVTEESFNGRPTILLDIRTIDLGDLIRVTEEMYNGRPLVFFSSIPQFGEVTNFEDLHLWAIATETRYGYDPETGIRMVTEYIAITSSGERIIYSKMETILVEWIAAPPSEVLDVLAEEVGGFP